MHEAEHLSYRTRFANLIDDLMRHEVFVLAASLAYTTGLALAPFILIVLSLASLLGDEKRTQIFETFTSVVGEQASSSVQLILENADKNPQASGISGIIGFAVLLISASAIFSNLRYALDKVNEHKITDKEAGFMGFLRDRFFSVGLLLGFIFLFIASLLLTTTLAFVFPGSEGIFWESIAFVVNFVIFAALFSAIYHFVPTDKMLWKNCAIAGATSAIFFVIGKTLIGFYLGKAGLESSYGAAGSIVVFLAWVYYSSLTLLISYEFTNWIILGKIAPQAHQRAPEASASSSGKNLPRPPENSPGL